METAIIILFSVLIGLTLGWLFLLRNTVRKHDKHLLEMEWEFNSYEKFTDKCLDRIVNINIELDIIKREVKELKNTTVTPPNIYGQTYCDGTHCTNPFHDCVGCPNQFGSGGTYTSTSFWTKSTDE